MRFAIQTGSRHLSAACLVGLALLAQSGCSRENRRQEVTLGKVHTAMPVAVNFIPPPEPDLSGDDKALRIIVQLGGSRLRAEGAGPVLRFFNRADPANPSVTMPWTDLESAWKATGCTQEMLDALDAGSGGQALICNGLVDLRLLDHVELVESGSGRTLTVSKWATWKDSEAVRTVAFEFY